jgi:CHRD domain-containing protein
MKRNSRILIATLLIAGILSVVLSSTIVTAQGNSNHNDDDAAHFKARLSGLQQVPTLFSQGQGSFRAALSPDGKTLTFSLTFSGLTGVSMAHIHFGERATNGGVIAFLCGGGSKPACPASSGTVTGTITATDIIGLPAQGFPSGDFSAFLASLKAGATYVNIHTSAFPAGEIRGQIVPG